mmetsp:Transcript_51178/g.147717  ORF Transcript_51178/g.147717 Transcript_51178/m.147717 type:complete len:213 (-) Transcript_51178:982-1620(-)
MASAGAWSCCPQGGRPWLELGRPSGMRPSRSASCPSQWLPAPAQELSGRRARGSRRRPPRSATRCPPLGMRRSSCPCSGYCTARSACPSSMATRTALAAPSSARGLATVAGCCFGGCRACRPAAAAPRSPEYSWPGRAASGRPRVPVARAGPQHPRPCRACAGPAPRPPKRPGRPPALHGMHRRPRCPASRWAPLPPQQQPLRARPPRRSSR